MTPDGAEREPRPRVDHAMIKAPVPALRRRKVPDVGEHATRADVATAKLIRQAHERQVLRLTLLAPEIVEALLDGRRPAETQLDDLPEPATGMGRTAHPIRIA